MLDETLSEMVAEEKVFNTQYWIEKNTRRTERVVEELLDRLVENDILQYEIGGFWELSSSVASSRSYESAEGASLQEAKSRILNVVLNDEIPTPRDVLLISLLHSCQFMKLLLTEEDYEEKLERIELLAGADLIGQSIASSIQQTTLLPRPRAHIGMATIPKVKWRDLLREKGFHRGNLPLGLCGVHKKFGPVIQTPLKFGKSRAILLTGQKLIDGSTSTDVCICELETTSTTLQVYLALRELCQAWTGRNTIDSESLFVRRILETH